MPCAPLPILFGFCSPRVLREKRKGRVESGVTYSISAFLSCCINKVLWPPLASRRESAYETMNRSVLITDNAAIYDPFFRLDCPVPAVPHSRVWRCMMRLWLSLFISDIHFDRRRRNRRKKKKEKRKRGKEKKECRDGKKRCKKKFRDALSLWNGLVTVARMGCSSDRWVSPVSPLHILRLLANVQLILIASLPHERNKWIRKMLLRFFFSFSFPVRF